MSELVRRRKAPTVLSVRRRSMSGKWVLLIDAVVCFLFVVAFNYVPLFGWMIAFFNYKPGISLFDSPFTGFKFFIIAMNDPELLMILRNTFVLSLLSILLSPLPALFAILLSEMRGRGVKKIVQTVTTLPNFISWVLVYTIAFAVFSVNDGVLNKVLLGLGVISKPTNLLANPNAVYVLQTAISVWKYLGYMAIIYFAAISGIDPELYDAASIDGAGRLGKTIHITIPGLYATYITLLVLSIASSLSNGFEQYYLFYNPLVHDRIQVLDYYVYRVGIKQMDFPVATALGISKTLVSILLLTLANLASKRLKGEYVI